MGHIASWEWKQVGKRPLVAGVDISGGKEQAPTSHDRSPSHEFANFCSSTIFSRNPGFIDHCGVRE
jgi:hypothetical protein